MAKKGQKFNSYTAEFKQKILDEWTNDFKSPGRLAHENEISKKTIET